MSEPQVLQTCLLTPRRSGLVARSPPTHVFLGPALKSPKVQRPSSDSYPCDKSDQIVGTPSSYDATGASGKINKHFFCPTCGSSLYTELEIMPDITCVKAGTLDNGGANLGGKIDVELYVKDRPSYLAAVEGAKQESRMG